ncbi:MAG: hypothetical protein JW863_22380 [Chitinispirillaceae bacterium]|nr:hypothetical protein [Chitinispirillaceae bacterium]
MKHAAAKKGSSKSSFVQAVLLIVFLVLGYLGYSVLKKGGLTAGLNSFLDTDISDFRSLQSMKEEQKTALQKAFGGFWVYRTTSEDAPVQKEERLELRDNGIIWQVIRWQVVYPDADTAVYYHVRHGYLNPYSIAADEKSVVCEVRTIRQVFIVDGDTCFGKSQVDELWQTRISDSLLIMNRRRYQVYTGELVDFFPEGMIDLIDKLIINDCTHGFGLGQVVREHLQNCYQNNEWTRSCDTNYLQQALSGYFEKAVMEELFSSIPYFPSLPKEVALLLTLRSDGRVILAVTKAKRAQMDHFTQLLYSGVENWPFPRCDAREMPAFHYIVEIPPP